MNKEQLKQLVSSDAWKYYEAGVKKEANTWRVFADQPGQDINSRLYLFAKAQGLDEALNLIQTWLNTDTN